jgi:hypothetical protein
MDGLVVTWHDVKCRATLGRRSGVYGPARRYHGVLFSETLMVGGTI